MVMALHFTRYKARDIPRFKVDRVISCGFNFLANQLFVTFDGELHF